MNDLLEMRDSVQRERGPGQVSFSDATTSNFDSDPVVTQLFPPTPAGPSSDQIPSDCTRTPSPAPLPASGNTQSEPPPTHSAFSASPLDRSPLNPISTSFVASSPASGNSQSETPPTTTTADAGSPPAQTPSAASSDASSNNQSEPTPTTAAAADSPADILAQMDIISGLLGHTGSTGELRIRIIKLQNDAAMNAEMLRKHKEELVSGFQRYYFV